MTTNNIEKTKAFAAWFDALDGRTRAKVLARITAMEAGNFGDHHAITEGHGVWELRFPGKGASRVLHAARRSVVPVAWWRGQIHAANGHCQCRVDGKKADGENADWSD